MKLNKISLLLIIFNSYGLYVYVFDILIESNLDDLTDSAEKQKR